jgi:HD superfamily phosphodiesterase
MLQYAEDAGLVTNLAIVDEVLDIHARELGHDRTAYRNHVYRVANLSVAITGDARFDLEKIAIAAVFHDLGIWTNKTFDYIAPSVALAREYLETRGMSDWIPEIEAMIADHHKVTSSRCESAFAGGIFSARRLGRRDVRTTNVRPAAPVHRGCQRRLARRRLPSTARGTDH